MTASQLERALAAKFGAVTRAGGGNGVELLVDCPWCGRHKLSVNASKGCWQCWHCHETGMVGRLLGRRVSIEAPERRPRPKARGYMPPGDLAPLDSLPDDHEAVLYVRRRGFDPAYLSGVFGLCYCSRGREYGGGVFDTSGTIVIPVRENGRDMAWQARLLYDPDKVREGEEAAYGWKCEDGRYKKPPKYFTSPGFKKGEHLFNIDQASERGFVVVTEGAFDAMRVGRCAVAAFGKSLTDAQVQIIRDRWPLAVLLLDPDAGGEQDRLKSRIEGSGPFGGPASSGTKCVAVRLEGYKDAGECPAGEVRRQIICAAEAEGVDLSAYSRTDPF